MNPNHLTVGLLLSGAVAVGCAAPALAASAYMDGIGNIGPGWSTITMPDGRQCAAGCTEVKYDYFSTQSAARAAGAWMDANNTPDSVLYTYSLSSTGAMDARALRPDWQGQIVALGSPAKPGNGATAFQGGRPALDVDGGKITFVSSAGDSVAYRTSGSTLGHLNNYKGRDFSKETPVKVSHPTDAVDDIEYGTPPKAPATTKPVRFNLFDMRTWFKPASAYQKAAADAPATTSGTADDRPQDADLQRTGDTGPASRTLKAADSDTARRADTGAGKHRRVHADRRESATDRRAARADAGSAAGSES